MCWEREVRKKSEKRGNKRNGLNRKTRRKCKVENIIAEEWGAERERERERGWGGKRGRSEWEWYVDGEVAIRQRHVTAECRIPWTAAKGFFVSSTILIMKSDPTWQKINVQSTPQTTVKGLGSRQVRMCIHISRDGLVFFLNWFHVHFCVRCFQ